MQTLFVRTPFESVAGSIASHYTITSNFETGRVTTVEVDGTDAARLNLQPVFPGKLTFKPEPGAFVPADPSAAGATTINGDLYLELSPLGLNELRAEAKDLGYPLVFAYLGVTLEPAFFNGTVLRGLQKVGGGYKKVIIGGVPLTTPAQLTNHFAQGHFSIDLKPTRGSAVSTFPTIQVNAGTKVGSVTLGLGVRTTVGPLAQPATIASLADSVNVRAQPHFATLSIPFFYRLLRHLTRWSTLAATGHEVHAFFSASDALENAAPLGRWRRLRVFPLGDRMDTVHPMSAYDDVNCSASDLLGTVLWNDSLTRLGEVYEQRADDEDFRLQLTNSAGTVLNISPLPIGIRSPSLTLKWIAPGPGHEPSGIDVTADIPSVPDPLVAMVPLEEGAHDDGGRTFNKDNVEIAQQELVRPLQRLLASFGFGVTTDPSGIYDVSTRHAVREFQREARTTERMSGGVVVPPANVVPFAGAINGIADVATLIEMGIWLTNKYRSGTTFYITKGGKRTDDVGFASATIKGAIVFANAGTAIGIIPLNKPRGLYNTSGLLLTAAVTDPAMAANFAGTIWEKRAICKVAHNESSGAFEALNTYDNAFLSAGLFNWTLGKDGDKGELPGICSTLSAADFARLFGKWSLTTTAVAVESGVLRGKFKLDGIVLTKNLKEEFRSFRWAYRFFQASQDMSFREAQYNNALSRINTVISISLTFNGTPITAGQLLQSEFLRALALDQHVNRPDHVVKALQACTNVLHDPDYLVSNDSNHPPTWVSDCYMIRMILEAKRIYGPKGTPTDLTQVEAQAAQDALNLELTNLKAICIAAATSTIAIVPATGKLAAMTQAQHDALAAIYKWRRENWGIIDKKGNLSLMTDPSGRWARISAGGHTGTLGSLSRTPNVFTP